MTTTISMYSASVPNFIRALGNLSAVLAKGEAHAEAKKIDPVVLINSRLYIDMLPLTRQVQIASDAAKGAMSRLAAVQAPSFADTETSFADLQARITKTIDYAKTFTPEQIDGSEDRAITIPTPNGPLDFTGLEYLNGFALPNLYFHCTTAYAILRHSGVEIGKFDFLGRR